MSRAKRWARSSECIARSLRSRPGDFGLGKRLYVPPNAVDGVTEECVILRHPKQEFHDAGLDVRPDQLMA